MRSYAIHTHKKGDSTLSFLALTLPTFNLQVVVPAAGCTMPVCSLLHALTHILLYRQWPLATRMFLFVPSLEATRFPVSRGGTLRKD